MKIEDKVIHDSFGKGVIISISDSSIVVDFGEFEISFPNFSELRACNE